MAHVRFFTSDHESLTEPRARDSIPNLATSLNTRCLLYRPTVATALSDVPEHDGPVAVAKLAKSTASVLAHPNLQPFAICHQSTERFERTL
jgi:hypothetical protein